MSSELSNRLDIVEAEMRGFSAGVLHRLDALESDLADFKNGIGGFVDALDERVKNLESAIAGNAKPAEPAPSPSFGLRFEISKACPRCGCIKGEPIPAPPKDVITLHEMGGTRVVDTVGKITTLGTPKDDGIEERARVWINSHDEPHDYFSYPTTCANFARSELAHQQKQHEIELVKARIDETWSPHRAAELSRKLAALESQQEVKP